MADGPHRPVPAPTTLGSRTSVIAALVVMVAAFLSVLQARTERQVQRLLAVPSLRLPELSYRIGQEEQRRVALAAEIAALRLRLEAITEVAGREQRDLSDLTSQLRAMRLAAGLVPLEGPGIVIELSDNPRSLRPGENPNELLLHYTDLVRVVGDLWARGAEAVAINDERLIGTSGIECVGTTILVNERRLSPPFRIAAIGDPKALGTVGAPGTGVDMLKAFSFPVRVVRPQSVEVPGFRGVIGSAEREGGLVADDDR